MIVIREECGEWTLLAKKTQTWESVAVFWSEPQLIIFWGEFTAAVCQESVSVLSAVGQKAAPLFQHAAPTLLLS